MVCVPGNMRCYPECPILISGARIYSSVVSKAALKWRLNYTVLKCDLGTRLCACIKEFVCVWESRCRSTIIKLCQPETWVCARAQSVCMWNCMFVCNGACDRHVRNVSGWCVVPCMRNAGWLGKGPPCARAGREQGTLHLQVLLNPKPRSRCPRETR